MNTVGAMNKKMYFKVYRDRDNIKFGGYAIAVIEEIQQNLQYWIDEFGSSEELMPLFEPVLMTEKEFKASPGFEGFLQRKLRKWKPLH